MERPLSFRALDLTGELGWLCGKILADWGADVVKIEPPGGESGRRSAPLLPDGVGAAWLAFNAGKRGIVLDLELAGDRERLLRLVEGADVVLESFAPGYLAGLGLSFERLRAANPRLVLTSITPYGQTAPAAAAPASDLELMAASGAVWLAGDSDRPPVRISEPQAACWASLHAALGTLVAHHHRELTGRGQHVDVSAQAAVVTALAHAPYFYDLNREVPARNGPFLVGRNIDGAAMRNVWPCRDGHVSFAIYGGAAGRNSNRQLVAWMAERAMAPPWLVELDWESFEPATMTADEVRRLEDAIAPFVLTVTRREFLEQAAARRILAYPVARVDDIACDPQLESREVWQEIAAAESGTPVRLPSGLPRFGSALPRVARPAPRVGEHDAEILGAPLASAR
ncbi:MAG: CoA transferase [Thermoleophilia bacterium]|nr:CoA transferase [Thermoleophilia bacterium]